MPKRVLTFIVRSEDRDCREEKTTTLEGQKEKYRLDMFLMTREAISCSRSQIRKLILDGDVTVNGKCTKSGYWVKEADRVVVTLPEPHRPELLAENIPLDILFEDEHLLVINKPVGMVVHPAPGHYTGTLVHALLHHCQNLPGIGGVQRPGIVHRLDRDTSGVILIAKTEEAHNKLSGQLKLSQLTRLYTTLVHGQFKVLSGCIEAPIGRHRKDRKKMAVDHKKGRYACSFYRVIQQYPEHTFLHVELKTGRTHQIRVHMKYLHHPVVGDLVYGNSSKNNLNMSRQALHAKIIRFQHPLSGRYLEFEAPLPEDMQQALEKLERMKRRS